MCLHCEVLSDLAWRKEDGRQNGRRRSNLLRSERREREVRTEERRFREGNNHSEAFQ
jgi:hypothetical protein